MNMKVLVVDDSPVASTVHAGILRKAGYECHIAENGAVALEHLMKTDYLLVISDVNMPRMDGYELVRRIRKTAGYEKVPVLMVSTECESKDILLAMQAGANLYVAKPISADQLLASVSSLLKVS